MRQNFAYDHLNHSPKYRVGVRGTNFSRAIASDTSSFDGSSAPFIRSETQYDGFGHVARASRPYFLGVDAPVWTTSSFVLNEANDNADTDPLARAWSVTAPDASVTTYTYDALVTSVTNANHATTTTLKNAQGLVASVTDAYGQPTTYTYDAFGDLTVANPPGPAIVRYTYDLRGRKLSAADPDMGAWSYAYDAFGALASQTDAKAQTVTMVYDTLGRMVSRTEPDMVSSWLYGTSVTNHNIDKLAKATCVAGASGNACGPSYSRSYFYDSLARPSQLTVAVGGVNYKTTTSYDATTGKPSQVRAFSGFTVNYGYTAHGYLATITDASAGTVYFTANARDASLELTQSTAGNGVVTTDSYDPLTGRMLNVCATHNAGACDGAVANISTTFDPVGNLVDRGDMLHDTSEVFTYDPLNRLTHYTVTGQGTNLSRSMRYNSAGSITEKSDVCAVNGCFAYTGAQPHAVSSITGTVNGIVNPTFAYDPNGNMTSGAGRTAQYTSFNMVSSVIEGTTTVALLYDPEHARIQQTAPEGTTLYLNDPASGAMTEHLTATSGMVTWRNYITVDGKIVAECSTTGSSATVRYFVLDHLGSTVALTKEDGTLAESDAYDAWGKARNATTGADDTTCSLPAAQFSTRGYTGHEEMPDLCLVNMNARIYDPTIGRFMSPDDVIPDLYNGQSFNRYTYVDNNPLSYDDPTGHAPNNPSCGVCGLDFSTNPDHPHGGKNFCPGCQMDFDTVDEEVVSHAPSTGLTDTGSGPSPSGFSQGGSNMITALTETSINGGFDRDNSPGIDDPVVSSPQSQQASDIDRAHSGGFGALDSGSLAGGSNGGQLAQAVPPDADEGRDDDSKDDTYNQDMRASRTNSAAGRTVLQQQQTEAAGADTSHTDPGMAGRSDPAFDKLINHLDGNESDSGRYESKIDRGQFRGDRAKFWESEAERNPGGYSPENLERMRAGRPPVGEDGYSMELHHQDGTPEGGVTPMTRTDHRLGPNYLNNHPWVRTPQS